METFSIIHAQGQYYQGVTLTVKEGRKLFNTNNIVQDFYDAVMEYLQHYRATNLFVTYAVSVDKWIEDTGMVRLHICFDDPIRLSPTQQQETIYFIAPYFMDVSGFEKYRSQ